MKKISAIFLFFVMMLCSSGFYIAWHISLQSVRYSQRAIISNSVFNKDKVIEFVISLNDTKKNTGFTYEDEDENEFEYKGQMYDIISKKTSGDSIYINCISDKEEDHLKDVAIHQIIKAENNTSGNQLPILKFSLDQFIHNFNNNNIVFFIEKNAQFYKKYNTGNLSSPYLNTVSPPPWVSA